EGGGGKPAPGRRHRSTDDRGSVRDRRRRRGRDRPAPLLDRGQEPVDHPRRAGGDRRGFPRAPPPALISSPPRGASSTRGGLSDLAKMSSMSASKARRG